MKHLLGLEKLSRDEILSILHLAAPMKDIILREVKKSPLFEEK